MITALVSLALLFAAPLQEKAAQDKAPQEKKPAGEITEEEFKKLHELKQEAAPPSKGTMVEIAKSKAYLSLPEGAKAPMPAVVVIHEWWGLNDHVKHWADRLAADGYAAVAVDLYGGTVATTPDEANAEMKKVDPARSKEILLAALAFLKDDPRVQATKRGSIGWCFGGKMSLQLALAAPDLDAAVMYYGHPELDPMKLEPMMAPLLGIFGTKDSSIPPKMVEKFQNALTEAKKEHTIFSYEAQHAFANPSNPKYDEENAGKAWIEVRKFLEKHLKAPAEARVEPK
ncbi:MAG: dienelactone hydrolase family protein [Planctomycetota bacterium]